ncbi:MAG: MFS transporter [Pseudonocardiaceae bacterium]|nr:MFS transporter [Pseudonocardiaceae bacterium]
MALCVTEIVSWGVLYYAFPVLVSDLARDTGWSLAAAMGAFSTGALVAAGAGIVVGRLIDARGPRVVMTAGSVIGVVAVVAIATAPNLPLFYAAWVLAGLAQSATLYPPAFAALTGWWQHNRIRALTVLTVVAGFSSTIFAPLTAWLLGRLDWRDTYLVLAVILAVVTIPLHALVLTAPWKTHPEHLGAGDDGSRAGHPGQVPQIDDAAHGRAVVRSRPFLVLTAVMAVSGFGMYAATINIVALLVGRGYDTGFAALALGLCGAGQVLGRLCYAPLTKRTSPRSRTAAVLAAGAATVAALGLLPGPAGALVVVALLAGAVRGVHTLLQAAAVADRWGTRAFGRINGMFSAPMTVAIALAPAGGVVLAGLVGSYPAGFTILAVVTLAAALAALVVDPRATSPQPAPARSVPR